MRIRYVVSSMLFWWRENHLSFEQECQFLKSQGFGIELWPTIKGQYECRFAPGNWERLAEATSEMLVSIYLSNSPANLEKWRQYIKCAKILNANIVTDLKCLSLQNGPDGNGDGFVSEVIDLAKDENVELCLETGDLEILTRVGEKYDSISFCLDTGYANIDRKYSFKQYVDQLAPRVSHLHLTDNYGYADDHQPPGLKGGITRENWDYLLDTLNKYDSDIIASFEMFPSMPSTMIRQAREFLFEDLNWPGKPVMSPEHENLVYEPL